MNNGQRVIELDRRRMTAMAERNYATLRELIADDLIYTHSGSRVDTKESLIGNMESGRLIYTRADPSDVVAQEFGDVVVLTGTCQIGIVSNGTPSAFGIRFTDVYADRDGKWQMLTWQSCRLPVSV
jgi:hypothetical protein